MLDCLELGVQTTHIGEVLTRQSLPFGRYELVTDIDAVDEVGSVSCADPDRSATSGELAQHHMQPTGGLCVQRPEIMMAIGKQPQHGGMAISRDGSQTAMAQPGDSGREGVVGIVLGCSRRAQQTHPGGQRGWYVDHLFADREQLLSE